MTGYQSFQCAGVILGEMVRLPWNQPEKGSRYQPLSMAAFECQVFLHFANGRYICPDRHSNVVLGKPTADCGGSCSSCWARGCTAAGNRRHQRDVKQLDRECRES